MAVREQFSVLRERGEVTGGPPPFAREDRSLFLRRLDEVLNAVRRKGS